MVWTKMRARRMAAAIGALLVVGISLGAQSATAVPPSAGFPSARPVKGLEWVPSDPGTIVAELRVKVVCPADDGEQYAIQAKVGTRLGNAGRFGDDPGEPVPCTGRRQVVSVAVQPDYFDMLCRVEAGTFPATLTLARVVPRADAPPETEAVATVTTRVKIKEPSTGIDCRNPD
jgi:hypothetical protein